MAALLTGAACSEAEPESSAPELVDDTSDTPESADGSIVGRYAGSEWFLGPVPEAAVEADSSLDPVKIGYINTDEAPVAAMPELHQATDAAVAFINAELGGIDGHPVELIACQTDLSAESAQACARKMVSENVLAVLPGISLGSGAAVSILEENGIGWIGGIPLNRDEMTSEISFQFSGGSPGAFAAFAEHAANTLQVERATVIYTDLPQVADAATGYGVALLEAFGVEVAQVPFDLGTQDYATVAQKAAESGPDAILVGAADSACPKIMNAVADLQLDDVTIYMVGSCADAKWLEQVAPGGTDDMVFNVENRVDPDATDLVDDALYNDVVETFGVDELNARGAGTVAFTGAMNLYAAMAAIGYDDLTPTSIIDYFASAVDHPSYNGHEYSCDGSQIPDLPSVCAAYQVLIRVDDTADVGFTEVSDGWIDVPTVIADL